MRPISDVAAELGLPLDQLEPYGNDKLKVPLSAIPTSNSAFGTPAKLIVVTAITPTPAGEGKSTTAVGLTQGLAKIGKKPVLTIRQPSLGPVFASHRILQSVTRIEHESFCGRNRQLLSLSEVESHLIR